MGATKGGTLLADRPRTELPATVSSVLAFSSGNVSTILSSRSHVVLESVNVSQVYILADQWDPVYRDSAGLLDATVCLWPSQETAACNACYAASTVSHAEEAACESCFITHHIYAHYLELVADAGRPICHTEAGGNQSEDPKVWYVILLGACLVSLMVGVGGGFTYACLGMTMPVNQ
jgi:hypothetical protein